MGQFVYMPAYIEAAADIFDIASDWLEIIDSGSSPSNSHLSQDSQEATITAYVPWNKQRSCARYFLGFAYADSIPPWRLYRENPAPHPVLPWLFAYDISFTPFIPKVNEDIDPPRPKIESPFFPGLYVAFHEKVIATVRYRNFRCRFLDDTEIANNQDEWQRNVFFNTEPKIEALQCTGGLSSLVFSEGTGINQPQAGVTRFGAPLAALLAKTGFEIHWTNVPFDYLSSDPDYFFPEKILDCVGTVNSDAFLVNLPAGTVLMSPPRFQEKRFPVASTDQSELLKSVDIVIPFEFFDPEKGSGTSSTFRGHNTFPWSGDGTTGMTGDGLFFGATRDGTAGGYRLLRATDHRTIFEHVNE